nr:unnamed protein product [Callosobruchus chinensis]
MADSTKEDDLFNGICWRNSVVVYNLLLPHLIFLQRNREAKAMPNELRTLDYKDAFINENT